jgi:pyruvate/2-oxoglutarate dehydrogenase complex dihydrolipoamide acyltransferase (E2) component
MTTKIVLTKSGMGIEEGTVVKWLKAEGAEVQQGEIIVEIETAKAIQEIEAPASGILTCILVAEGREVPVNTDLGEIEEHTGA